MSKLPPILYEQAIRKALLEDLGRAGDLTTDLAVGESVAARGEIVACQAGVAAGLDIALAAFKILDPAMNCCKRVEDGSAVKSGQSMAELQGSARALLSAERTALNFLGRLSGIATLTSRLAAALQGTKCRVACTRKTTPGLRALEKYAVRTGGGFNHRFGLDDAVLIKDNHIAVAGGIRLAVERIRAGVGHLTPIEVEVESFDQLEEALALEVDAVLLDNMNPKQVLEAVRLVNGRLIVEASGGITPENA
ncbi:MAG TPA: carboxylating nicotinate-nucleotide diphosphorylase, partial [Acidobacteriota bacterium]|nr:carboxylating nicotinate-nucleotide diphosphorylase [Acidobacteriota bacterium]